jgi:hypothetical protein
LKAIFHNKVAETMSNLIDVSAKPWTALIQGRENDEPINHPVHSTTYVEDFGNISVAKSKKKILLGANLCNNEKKIDVMSCVLIGSILLKIKELKDHIRIPQGFPRLRDTSSQPNNEIFPSCVFHCEPPHCYPRLIRT